MKKSVYILAFLLLLPISLAVNCGDTITEPSVLDRDLECSRGLILEANLDCNGFNYSGLSEGSGLIISGNNLIIENCNINSFENGILIEGYNGSIFRNNTLDRNVVGMFISEANTHVISGNTISNSLNYGIFLQFSKDVSYEDNAFVDNDEDIKLSDAVKTIEPAAEENEIIPIEIIPEPEVITEEEVFVVQDRIFDDEQLLDLALKLEYTNVTPAEINKEIANLKSTLKNVEIKREFIYTKDSTKVIVTITPEKSFFKRVVLEDVALYERIPKCFASFVGNIAFEENPKIINPDPLVKKAFPKIDDELDFSYSTKKVITKDCEKLFKAILIADVSSFATYGGDLFEFGPIFVIKTFPGETVLVLLGIIVIITLAVRFKKAGEKLG